MNIILFSVPEVQLPLPRDDSRARHILQVLKRKPGETFDAGLINGPRGKGTLVEIRADSLALSFTWRDEPPPLAPIRLIVGLPRPQTARNILRECTAMGVGAIDFIRTERGEASYASSSLWAGEWRTLLLAGAAQAFCTRLPEIRHGHALAEALDALPANTTRIALDNYEPSVRLGAVPLPTDSPVTLAFGAERGWSAFERELLVQRGFLLAHLGERVLRSETACIAAVAAIKTRLGLL